MAAENMQIPSKDHCYQLMCEMRMMDHIAAHSIRVCQVALLLVDRLEEQAVDLNRDLVRASALLHDITKTRSFETKENHAETAGDLLMDSGYAEVSRIVGQHVRLDAYISQGALSEAEIVNYSDKRVLHDRVVSLDKRFDYIMERYARVPADRMRIRWLTEKTADVGRKIFDRLSFTPDALEGHLDPEIYTRCLEDYRSRCGIHRSDADTRT